MSAPEPVIVHGVTIPVPTSASPIWTHRLYARVGGYFWANCERCGGGFGGHQWHGKLADWMTVTTSPNTGRCAFCPRCAVELKERVEPLGSQWEMSAP